MGCFFQRFHLTANRCHLRPDQLTEIGGGVCETSPTQFVCYYFDCLIAGELDEVFKKMRIQWRGRISVSNILLIQNKGCSLIGKFGAVENKSLCYK